MLSKTWRCRPSELFGLDDPFVAYCFDRAVATFGMEVEADMDAASEDASNSKSAAAARIRTLNKWLSVDGEVRKGSFRDPFGG